MSSNSNEYSGRHILVVDDKPANLNLLTKILGDKGYVVRPVLNGTAALKAAKDVPPDLVLLDIGLPDMSGYEVCQQLKTDDELARIPIIFLSGLSDTQAKVDAFKLGGVDYVTKPFEAEEVLSRVHTHISKSQLERKLERNYKELLELDNLRGMLAHMLAHDMRNPLTGILASFQIVLNTSNPAVIKEYSELGIISAEQVIEMISSYLDVYQMENNKMDLNLTECDLSELVIDVETHAAPLLDKVSTSHQLPDKPCVIMCDQRIITRVLRNLLDNAIKFSPKNTTIELALTQTADGARISVLDQGPGISEDKRGLIFEKFGQVKDKKNTTRYSSGLGLTFCKMAVELHGGKVGVDSREETGSCFWVELPACPPGCDITLSKTVDG